MGKVCRVAAGKGEGPEQVVGLALGVRLARVLGWQTPGSGPGQGSCVWEAGECWPGAAVTFERKRNVGNVGHFLKLMTVPSKQKRHHGREFSTL